jgi:hypothetical protein
MHILEPMLIDAHDCRTDRRLPMWGALVGVSAVSMLVAGRAHTARLGNPSQREVASTG